MFGGLVFFTLFLFALPLAKHFYNSSQESMHEIQELESKGEIVSSWSKMKIAAKAMRRMSSLPPTEGRTEAVATKESLRWDHLPSRESTAVQVYGPRTRQAQLDNSHDDLLVDERKKITEIYKISKSPGSQIAEKIGTLDCQSIVTGADYNKDLCKI